MALGSCLTCVKYLMFAFNFLFWILGCAILGVGIWVLVDENIGKYNEQLGLLHTGAYILIAIGCIITIVGFLGCCGAIRESQCMLGTFFLLLFIIFAVLLGAGIWAVVAKSQVRETVGERLKASVENYYVNDGAHSFMDLIQSTLNCCGHINGVDDYQIVPEYDVNPKSCKPEYVEDGCEPKLFEFIADKLVIIAGIAIGVAVILILGMIFSMVLCCAIRDGEAMA